MRKQDLEDGEQLPESDQGWVVSKKDCEGVVTEKLE